MQSDVVSFIEKKFRIKEYFLYSIFFCCTKCSCLHNENLFWYLEKRIKCTFTLSTYDISLSSAISCYDHGYCFLANCHQEEYLLYMELYSQGVTSYKHMVSNLVDSTL